MANKNPRLKKPHQQTYYTQEQAFELARCMADPIYFIKNYIYIKHPIRGKIKFALFGYQEDLIRAYQNNRYNIVLSARQTGKTETSCAYLLWFALFHESKDILVVSNKSSNAMEIIKKIQYAYEELPDWLKIGIDDNNWNKHNCGFENKSLIKAEATSSNSGRGMSLALVYCDELAFVQPHMQKEFWDSIYPTLSTGGGCIISSTPNGDSDLFSTLWRGSKDMRNGFYRTFVPWDSFPGRDEEFKQEKIAILGERKWRQEYECEFLSSDGNLFDTRLVNLALQELKAAKIQPVLEIDDVVFWKPIEIGRSYLVAVDPGTGSGDDYTHITIMAFPSLIQVGEYRTNTMSHPETYVILKKILSYLDRHRTNTYFTVENNGIGQGLIALYQADETQPTAMFLSDPVQAKKGKLGFFTSEHVKSRTCLQLKELFERNNMIILSETTLDEMKSFVRKGVRYEAQKGATDDAVMSLVLIVRMVEVLAKSDPSAYDKLYSIKGVDNTIDEKWASSKKGSIEDDIYSLPMPVII